MKTLRPAGVGYPDILPKDTLPKDTLPKDILPNGHFADGHLVERTFSRTDSMTSGLFAKRQLAENREILGIVTDFSKMCNSQSLCNYKITIVRSLPYITVHNGSLAAHNDYY